VTPNSSASKDDEGVIERVHLVLRSGSTAQRVLGHPPRVLVYAVVDDSLTRCPLGDFLDVFIRREVPVGCAA
jgi:hypothetical protein